MKTTMLKIATTVVLGLASVSAVRAAPAMFGDLSVIAYDQRGGNSFPTSAPEATPLSSSLIAYDQRGGNPFPTSAPEASDTGSAAQLAYHTGGSDPFPTSAPEAIVTG